MGQLLEYKGYHTTMTYDSDDDILVWRPIGITDIIAFHANDVKEFKEVFHRSVDDYIEFCLENGKQPEKEYKAAFNVRVTPELHKQLVLKAEADGETLNAAVVHAITQYVSMGWIILYYIQLYPIEQTPMST